jgi:hypothetical protein
MAQRNLRAHPVRPEKGEAKVQVYDNACGCSKRPFSSKTLEI